jgi:hypothetical protein
MGCIWHPISGTAAIGMEWNGVSTRTRRRRGRSTRSDNQRAIAVKRGDRDETGGAGNAVATIGLAAASARAAPAVLPEIVTGLRVGFSLTLLGVLIGEMFASQQA